MSCSYIYTYPYYTSRAIFFHTQLLSSRFSPRMFYAVPMRWQPAAYDYTIYIHTRARARGKVEKRRMREFLANPASAPRIGNCFYSGLVLHFNGAFFYTGMYIYVYAYDISRLVYVGLVVIRCILTFKQKNYEMYMPRQRYTIHNIYSNALIIPAF